MTSRTHQKIIISIFCVLTAGVLVSFVFLIREMQEAGKFFFFEEYVGFSRFTFSVSEGDISLFRVRFIASLGLQITGILFASFFLRKPSFYWHEGYRFYLFLFVISFQALTMDLWNWILVFSQEPESSIVLLHRSALLMRVCGDVALFISTVYCYGIQQKSYGTLSLVVLLVLGRFLLIFPIDLSQLDFIHPYDIQKFWSIDVISLMANVVTIFAYVQLAIRNKDGPAKRWHYVACLILVISARQVLIYGKDMVTVFVAMGIMLSMAPWLYSLLISVPFFSQLPPKIQERKETSRS